MEKLSCDVERKLRRCVVIFLYYIEDVEKSQELMGLN